MRVYSKMTTFGVLLWFTGCVKLHKDANSFKCVFRRWHPLTWLLAVLMILPCALSGTKLSEAIPLNLTEFWVKNMDQLQWVTPFTDVSTLKPFKPYRVQSAM